jgi:hypothetical protein
MSFDYDTILNNMVQFNGRIMEEGKTVLFTWRNEEHLKEWTRLVPRSDDVRIISLESKHLPMLRTEDYDYARVTIAGIATGVEKDMSDVVCLYHYVCKK